MVIGIVLSKMYSLIADLAQTRTSLDKANTKVEFIQKQAANNAAAMKDPEVMKLLTAQDKNASADVKPEDLPSPPEAKSDDAPADTTGMRQRKKAD